MHVDGHAIALRCCEAQIGLGKVISSANRFLKPDRALAQKLNSRAEVEKNPH